MRILIIGASGMIGSGLMMGLSRYLDLDIYGICRSNPFERFADNISSKIITGLDISDFDRLMDVMGNVKPNMVINCIGIVKQSAVAEDAMTMVYLNAYWPHRLARICKVLGCRMIHISTDCVFSGDKGNYTEADAPDATDLYGRSKALGEVVDQPHCLSVRTSTIGPELKQPKHGLLEWFLAQERICSGYSKAIYSGLTTLELANIFYSYIFPRTDFTGLYQIAGPVINKYELLKVIGSVYEKKIDIISSDKVKINRSLNATRFFDISRYTPPSWEEMLQNMRTTYSALAKE